MADTKLTNLPPLSSAQSSDLLYIVSLQTSASGSSEKISISNLFGSVNVPVTLNNQLNTVNIRSSAITTGSINVTNQALISNLIALTANIDSIQLNNATINNLSASAIVVQTLSAQTLTVTNFEVDNNTTATTLSALTGNITTLITDFLPATLSSTLTVTYSGNNGRVYNFDTTVGSLSVVIPSVIPNGFNIGITNIGTNTVYISSTQAQNISAFSYKCTRQFGAIFIYKTNNTIFGVGAFE